MIKHIVMWKLKEEALGNSKKENALLIKDKLEALRGQIPEILDLEVGIDFLESEQSYDIVLVSTFASKEALDIYQKHPKHVEVGAFVGEVRLTRTVVDYEV